MSGGRGWQWRNDAVNYGAISIALHWTVALIVLMLLATAGWAWIAPTADIAGDRLRIHGAIGTLGLVLIATRIAWHVVEQRPVNLARSPLDRIARATHVALLTLIGAQLVTGPIDIWTGGWPIGVFTWFAIPSPIGDFAADWHDVIGTVHRYTGYSIALLLALHLAAACKHLLIDRDQTLQRMLGIGHRSAVGEVAILPVTPTPPPHEFRSSYCAQQIEIEGERND